MHRENWTGKSVIFGASVTIYTFMKGSVNFQKPVKSLFSKVTRLSNENFRAQTVVFENILAFF